MSNTIRHPRKRPRVKSVNFRSLWWLITREAAWLVMSGSEGRPGTRYTRRGFAGSETYYAVRLAEALLRYRPERRYIP